MEGLGRMAVVIVVGVILFLLCSAISGGVSDFMNNALAGTFDERANNSFEQNNCAALGFSSCNFVKGEGSIEGPKFFSDNMSPSDNNLGNDPSTTINAPASTPTPLPGG